MDAMFCFHCGLYHDKASMIKGKIRGGRRDYMCPQCYEKIQRNLNANPAVKKAMGKTVKKRYQKGGRRFEDFIKHCTKGD